MEKILLYYHFRPLADPEAVRLWQKNLCQQLNLRGRILISVHGINGTVGGEVESLRAYVRATRELPAFKDMTFKWSDGNREDFPKLTVRVRDELVGFGVPERIAVDDKGVVNGGTHLKPEEVHKLVEEKGEEVVFFDGRNGYEGKVGRFKNAVIPEIRTSRELIEKLDAGEFDELKDKPVVTYCTGGIRCEIITALMKQRGFSQVYQMDGGVVKYGEKFGDEGLWEGNLYVFDKRMSMKFSDQAKTIGECAHCHSPAEKFINCRIEGCDELFVICDKCSTSGILNCPAHLSQIS